MKKYKIFMGLTEIAGYYTNLKKGFDRLGIENTFINLHNNRFKYGGEDESLWLVKFLKKAIDNFLNTPKTSFKNKFKRRFWKNAKPILEWLLFIYALLNYDVFIFGSRTSFFERNKDLPILKFFRKKIICVFHGSDSRPPYLDGSFYDLPAEKLAAKTKLWKEDIDFINKYADYIVCHSPTGMFHTKPFISWFKIGIPFYLPYDNEFSDIQASNLVKIIHAPSDPVHKGTPIIRKVITELKEEGYKIDFVELIDKPNSKVIDNIKTCDFVVDQVFSDTPMAGLATEAAWFGKPSIVCGMEINEIIETIIPEDVPPSLCGKPDMLKENIIKLIENRNFKEELGKKAQEFVKTKWSSESVAKRYLEIICGDFSTDWYINPKDADFVYGWGLNETQRNEMLNKVISLEGESALMLEDKPELKNKLLNFVKK